MPFELLYLLGDETVVQLWIGIEGGVRRCLKQQSDRNIFIWKNISFFHAFAAESWGECRGFDMQIFASE